MFIIERIFGFGLYMLVLMLVCLLLIKTNISSKKLLRAYTVFLCVIAFLYKPYITGDLYRIYETMDFFATMDFKLFWTDFALESSIPIARLLYWIFGKTGVNSLLPVFSALVCYSIIFHIFNKTKELYSVSSQNMAFVLFFVMSNSIYISVIGGIRMMLALCMIIFSLFRITVEKKFSITDILFFAASIFIHTMSLAVLGVCMLVALFDSGRSMAKKIGYISGIGAGCLLFALFFRDTVISFYNKFLGYIFGDKHSDFWEYIMGGLIVIVLVFLFVEYRSLYKANVGKELRKINLAGVLCVAIGLIFCFEFSMFYRFAGQLAVLLCVPSMMVTLQNTEGKPSRIIKSFDFRSILIIMSIIIALISCTRGSLSSLKLFEL